MQKGYLFVTSTLLIAAILAAGTIALAAPSCRRLFDEQLDELERTLTAAAASGDIVAGCVDANLRLTAFRLEALGRLYEARYPGIEGLHREIKALEDALGDYVFFLDMAGFIGEITRDERVMQHLQARVAAGKSELQAFLVGGGWVEPVGPKVAALRTAVRRIEWPDEPANRELLIESVARYARKVGDRVHRGRIDPHDVEQGTHELRRNLRWILMYLQFARGQFTLDEACRPIPACLAILDDPIVRSPFARLPAPERADPIRIPQTLYLTLTRYVDDLDDAKDVGEAEHLLAEVLLEAGRTRSPAEAEAQARALARKHRKHCDHVAVTSGILEEIQQTDILNVLAGEIEKQR